MKKKSLPLPGLFGMFGHTGLALCFIAISICGCDQLKSRENEKQILTALSQRVKDRLIELRLRSKKEKWGFTPVYTDLIAIDLIQMTGAIVPVDLDEQIRLQNLKADSVLKEFHESFDRTFSLESDAPIKASWKNASFDWRKLNGTTPVKDQGLCGSCWVFGTHAALEGSWRIKFKNAICCSEQNSLDWNKKSNCNGGWPSYVCDYLTNEGGATCGDYPYTLGKRSRQQKAKYHPYFLRTWGYVGKKSGIPSVRALKKALIDRGPLIAGVYVSNAWGGYGDTNEVYDVCSNKTVNHIVAIIGWDDSKGAWLIKNSWGTNWGSSCGYGSERGYIWIKYNCSGIGYGAIWVVPNQGRVEIEYGLDKSEPPPAKL